MRENGVLLRCLFMPAGLLEQKRISHKKSPLPGALQKGHSCEHVAQILIPNTYFIVLELVWTAEVQKPCLAGVQSESGVVVGEAVMRRASNLFRGLSEPDAGLVEATKQWLCENYYGGYKHKGDTHEEGHPWRWGTPTHSPARPCERIFVHLSVHAHAGWQGVCMLGYTRMYAGWRGGFGHAR